jgi:hypothetical protein
MSVRTLGVVLLTAGVLSGCGTSARDAVKAKVEQYGRATRDHDYKTLCTQVLAPSLVARLTSFGLSCERAMTIAYGPVKDATLGVGKVTVNGTSASVIVLSLAANQPSSLGTVQLVKTAQGWRIISESSLTGGSASAQ